MPKHLLVATDGSALADGAVEYAVDLAAKTGARVTAVTVSEMWSPAEIASRVQSGDYKAVEQFEKHASDAAAGILAHTRDVAGKRGVAIETVHVPDQRPAEGILRAAKDHGCDLIVMASHGRRGISRLFLGSQAQEVLGQSDIPVLICK